MRQVQFVQATLTNLQEGNLNKREAFAWLMKMIVTTVSTEHVAGYTRMIVDQFGDIYDDDLTGKVQYLPLSSGSMAMQFDDQEPEVDSPDLVDHESLEIMFTELESYVEDRVD